MTFKQELAKGIKIEQEHSHLFPKNLRKAMTTRIAKDHIKEFPKYYSRGLLPMERMLRKK